MDALNELISVLNEQDKLAFKAFLTKKNKRLDVKNIKLFNSLETDDINTINSFYKSAKNRDAYHALRKRLHESLLVFLSQKTFESNTDETYAILRYLLVARFMLENNLIKQGFKTLQKAEKLAEESEQYSYLNEILLLRLQFSHLDERISLTELTEKFQLNQQQMQREAKLRLAYAALRRELNEIHLKGKVVNLTDLIEKTIKHYHINRLDLMNYKSLYQILFIANEYAAINQNYSLIQKYLVKSHRYIESQKLNQTAQVFYHAHILYYLANFTLRSKQFSESLNYLQQLDSLLDQHKSYRQLLAARIHLLYGLNYFFNGQAQIAIDVLEKAMKNLPSKSSQEDMEDLTLSMCMFLAQLNDAKALRYLAKLTHTDAWYEKKLGMLWTIRKNLMEILLQVQFENIELAISRMQSFKRRYKSYLSQVNEHRVLQFLQMVEKYLANPDLVFQQSFQQSVYSLLDTDENKDIFNLSFIAWVISRWEKRNPYEVTLKILQQQQEFSPTKMT